MTDDWRRDRIGAALRGENPTVMRRLAAGFAVIGDVQFLPGYSVLLVDEPGVGRLSELPKAKRPAFLSDMDRLGEALYPRARWTEERSLLGPRHDGLRHAIGSELDGLRS
ncbi:hypothetical protein ACIQNU_35005 [Streptomyces sp. NPDC091292]|uniref:hypothetical protein n=1 Tax=Streptomyces sp. NPDC091292 TaxID=3365991 RepID=UPI0037F2AFD0